MSSSLEYFQNFSDFNLLDSILPRYIRIIGNNKFHNNDIHSYLNIDTNEDILKIRNQNNDNPLVLSLPFSKDFLIIPGILKPSNVNIKNNETQDIPFTLFPMDFSSALPIYFSPLMKKDKNNSNIQSLKVLDLCCCPGAKLQYIYEKLDQDSLLVGVDISESRLYVCKSLLNKMRFYLEELEELNNTVDDNNEEIKNKKIKLSITSDSLINKKNNKKRLLLFHGDGRNFLKENKIDYNKEISSTLFFDSYVDNYIQKIYFENSKDKNRKKKNKGIKDNEMKLLKRIQKVYVERNEIDIQKENEKELITQTSFSTSPKLSNFSIDSFDKILFDLVFVDAECTHDASYRHLKYDSKEEKWGKKEKDEKKDEVSSITLSHADDKEELKNLQRNLLQNGYDLLKIGGTLIYSTCSDEDAQNEEIISYFLSTNSTATLLPLTSEEKDNFHIYSQEDIGDKQILHELKQIKFQSDSSSLSASSLKFFNYIASLQKIPLIEGKIKGTYRTNLNIGMSGHFIARITKNSI